MPPPLDHEGVLKKICGICCKKNKSMKNITKTILERIHDHFFEDYSVTSGDFPTVLCSSCEVRLRATAREVRDGLVSRHRLPVPRYETIRGTRASRSGSSSGCPCGWCAIWRLNGNEHKKYMAENKTPMGRPLETVPPPAPGSRQLCDRCHGEVRSGVRHDCTVRDMEQNIFNEIVAAPEKSKERGGSVHINNI